MIGTVGEMKRKVTVDGTVGQVRFYQITAFIFRRDFQ